MVTPVLLTSRGFSIFTFDFNTPNASQIVWQRISSYIAMNDSFPRHLLQ